MGILFLLFCVVYDFIVLFQFIFTVLLSITIDLFFLCLVFLFGAVCVEWIIHYFDICMYVYLYVCM